MHSDQLEQWLLSLPLGEACEIDSERVYLKLGDGGAELGLILIAQATQAQIAEAMRTGFQSALEFQAGLALSPEDGDLHLTRWMPGAEAWSDVGDELEELLNQAALWRAAMEVSSGPSDAVRRDDARMRLSYQGG